MTAEQAQTLIDLGWSIYSLLGFTVVVVGGGWVVYQVLRPLYIFLRAGHI